MATNSVINNLLKSNIICAGIPDQNFRGSELFHDDNMPQSERVWQQSSYSKRVWQQSDINSKAIQLSRQGPTCSSGSGSTIEQHVTTVPVRLCCCQGLGSHLETQTVIWVHTSVVRIELTWTTKMQFRHGLRGLPARMCLTSILHLQSVAMHQIRLSFHL